MKRQLSADRDPVGSTYMKGQKVYRDIRGEFKDYFLSILEEPKVNQLLGKSLVDTKIIKESANSLTLEHPLISPPSYAYEWPLPMLKDAALLTIDINLALLEKEAVLKDATPWNILYRNTSPIWVDLEFNKHMLSIKVSINFIQDWKYEICFHSCNFSLSKHFT